jgi:enoyl-CoA hydratase
MEYQNLLTEIKDNILYVTINRPLKMNALNRETLKELADVVIYANTTAEVLGVLLTGAGEKAFVAGADISEFADFDVTQGEQLARDGQTAVFNAIERSTKPFVAAINGFALGGGLELAMACHLRIAAEGAKLGLPEVTLGLIPGYGGTQRLTQLVGKGRAFEMIATADMITAQKAAQIGLVNEVVPAGELLATAERMLGRIKQRAPLAIAQAIAAVNAAVDVDVNGYDVEIKAFAACFGTTDFKEGVSAFLEKRSPQFSGN